MTETTVAPATAWTQADTDAIGYAVREMLGTILYLGAETIGWQQDFAELGLDSILAVEFAEVVEQQFGVRTPVSTIYSLGTVRAYASYVAEALSAGVPA